MESLNNIGYLLATILLPMFAYRIAHKAEIKTLLKSSLSVIYCLAVSLIVCFFTYRLELMQLLYNTANSAYSAEVFGYLLLNFFPVAILYVIGTLLTANQNFRLMILTLVIAVIINISLNYFLIIRLGAKGAGIATLITQLFMLVCYSVYTFRIFSLSINIRYILQLLGFGALCILLLFILNSIRFSASTPLNLAYHILLYLICIPVLSYILGLVNLKSLELKVGYKE